MKKYKLEVRGLGALVCDNFSSAYPELNKEIYLHGERQDSRNGMTGEILNFKTTIHEQTKRCVGGYKRNMNIFFLLAESLWIYKGQSDVKFMDTFNSQLKNYSDDGVNYHAPYGYRLRSHGLSSSSKGEQYRMSGNGKDQLIDVVRMLEEEPDSRRVVATLWNPDLDLNVSTKDLPCNDILMWKIRNNELHITIGNRSNDLHWGLTTNVFQFSFLNEIIARVLGIKTGTQVHNSQSLHVYMELGVCQDMINSMKDEYNNLYDTYNSATMDFNFKLYGEDLKSSEKIMLIDSFVEKIIFNLNAFSYDGESIDDLKFLKKLQNFSNSLFEIYSILKLYCNYKNTLLLKKEGVSVHEVQLVFLKKLIKMNDAIPFKHEDYYIMALNFFASRIPEKELAKVDYEIPKGVGQF